MILRDYQIDIAFKSFNILKDKGIVYLAIETRCGKTIIAMETCKLYGAKKVLFVTKKKAIGSIESDYSHYKNDFACVIVNYESVLKVKDKYDIVICDESHAISAIPKPPKRWKDLRQITYDTPVILMSATPSPESYSQLFHQFTINKFHSWNKARNFYEWARYYVNKKVKYLYGREINDYSDAKIELIEPKIKDYMITFTQVEAGFSQFIDEKIITCKMKSVTYEIIETLNRDKVVWHKEAAILGDTAVKLMSKVHQLCSGTFIDEGGEGFIVDNSKAEYLRQYFVGMKIAIFYKFKQEFEMLKQSFPNYTESPEDFQTGNYTFLGQFQSAREGIRLDKAEALVFFNIDFSFLSYEQSKNRILSKERTEHAPLFWIFSEGGIEEKIYRVVCLKKNYTVNYYKKDFVIK